LSILGALKDPPGRFPFYFIPPTQADQQSPCNVLDDPKVGSQQQNTADGYCDEIGARNTSTTVTSKPSSKDVQKESKSFEENVENADNGM
jgi:hypothetical protein